MSEDFWTGRKITLRVRRRTPRKLKKLQKRLGTYTKYPLITRRVIGYNPETNIILVLS